MRRDRVRLHPLEGMVPQTIDPTFVDLGGIRIDVREVYRRAGPNIEDDARALYGAAEEAPEIRALDVEGALGAAAVVPTKLMPREAHYVGDGGVLSDAIGRAIIAHPDGTLVEVSVFTSPEMADSGLSACKSLAARILETIEVGGRRLDLRGGEKRLKGFMDGRDLVLDIPPGSVQEGVSRVRVVALGTAERAPATLEVDTYDTGGERQHPPPHPPGVGTAAATEPIRIGELLSWGGPCTPNPSARGPFGWKYEQSLKAEYPDPDPNRDRGIWVFAHAPDQGSCEQMKSVARSMRIVSP